MYKISVPINSRTTNSENRSIYIDLFKKAEVDRVFLCASLTDELDHIRENIRIFKENGFEVGIWTANIVGHGATVVGAHDSGEKPKYQRLVDLDGNDHFDTFCPFDASHREFVASSLQRLALLGADLLMLDDDFRLSQHGGAPCCFCELHMEKIRQYCGENVSREQIRDLIFAGKPNKYRDAYLRAQGESLELLASDIRKAVDKVAPELPIAVCSAYSSWDLDGTDPLRITDILAGKNKKYLRLHGAPYWSSVTGKPLEGVCEIGRMFASFCRDRDIEIFSEGDTFRPRTLCPSSFLEIFDVAMRADGAHDGILKYMLGYDSTPLYETGYVDRHVHNLPLYKKLEGIFENGANCGVRILIKPHLLKNADMKHTPLRQQSPYPGAAFLLAKNAIPTVYRGEGICAALFGENARCFDSSEYRNGAILDGAAAAILTELGKDVGIEEFREWHNCDIGSIKDVKTGISTVAYKAQDRLMTCKLKRGAIEVLTASVGGEEKTFAYKYENSEGQRFLVFTFCADAMVKNPIHWRAYEIQDVLLREIEWIARKPMPVKTVRAPELYTLCEKGEDHTSAVFLNCFYDSVLDPIIELDREYSKIEFCNCSGRLEGKRVLLDQSIAAYDFAAFRAFDPKNNA